MDWGDWEKLSTCSAAFLAPNVAIRHGVRVLREPGRVPILAAAYGPRPPASSVRTSPSPSACCAAQQAEAGGDGGQSDEAGRGHHPAACAGAAALGMELGE